MLFNSILPSATLGKSRGWCVEGWLWAGHPEAWLRPQRTLATFRRGSRARRPRWGATGAKPGGPKYNYRAEHRPTAIGDCGPSPPESGTRFSEAGVAGNGAARSDQGEDDGHGGAPSTDEYHTHSSDGGNRKSILEERGEPDRNEETSASAFNIDYESGEAIPGFSKQGSEYINKAALIAHSCSATPGSMPRI